MNATTRRSEASAQQQDDHAGSPAPSALPLFAVAVAQRKWEILQADGYRMQRIEFARSIDGQETRGIIDPWGRVLWKYGQDDHAGSPAPSAWMWQHEETGNVGFVDPWQVDNGWQQANPRLKLIRPLYTHPAPSESSKAALSDEEIDQLRDVLHRARIQFPEGSILRHDLEAARTLLARAGITRKPLTEEQVADIVREASRGAATRRDGTTSRRIVRAVEQFHGITPQAGKESGE